MLLIVPLYWRPQYGYAGLFTLGRKLEAALIFVDSSGPKHLIIGVIGKNYQLLYRRGRGFFFAAPIECPVYLWCALCMLGPTVVVGSSSLHPLSLRAIYSVRYACWALNELAGTGDPSS